MSLGSTEPLRRKQQAKMAPNRPKGTKNSVSSDERALRWSKVEERHCPGPYSNPTVAATGSKK